MILKANGLYLVGYATHPDGLTITLKCTYDEAASFDPKFIEVKDESGKTKQVLAGYRKGSVKVNEDGTCVISCPLTLDSLTSGVQDIMSLNARYSDDLDTVKANANPQLTAFASLALQPMAATMSLKDAATVSTLWPEWAVGVAYKVKEFVTYGGEMYRCSQVHTSQADWAPDKAASMWAHVGVADDGLLVWSADAIKSDPNIYDTGTRVHYPDKTGPVYVSKRDGNTSEPSTDEWWEVEK